ncbi:MAG: GTP cyclohydrolase I [Sphingobacteriia bacterium]|nr:GTP cyclohydrolase I [Sphingobacteriia bacterium]
MRTAVAGHVAAMLEALLIDWEADPNTRETPARVARMLVDESMRGRYAPRPRVTVFPNTRKLDELYTVGPVTVRSMCSHHLVPIVGSAWIGVIPGDTLIGLSKFARLTDWIMARPQIQEEAAVQLADEIEALIKPRGLAVMVKARHLCLSWRGAREPEAEMTTSILRGILRESPAARAEFFETIKGSRFAA